MGRTRALQPTREGLARHVNLPAGGEGAAWRREDLAEVLARLVAGEVARHLHYVAVAPLLEDQARLALLAGQIDGMAALSGPALRERGRIRRIVPVKRLPTT